MTYNIDLSYRPSSFSSYLTSRDYHVSDSLLLIDFDDTLFPTTYLERHNLHSASDADSTTRHQIDRVERRALKVLETSAISRAVIVTTASLAWVEEAMEDWMPTLARRTPPIVSATETYSHVEDSDGFDRKLWAFRAAHNDEDAVVVAGDGPFEMWAGKVMQNESRAEVTNIQYVDYPDSEKLVAQLEFTYRAINAVTKNYHNASFALSFSD